MGNNNSLFALVFGGTGCAMIVAWLVTVAMSLGFLAAALYVIILVLRGTGVINS